VDGVRGQQGTERSSEARQVADRGGEGERAQGAVGEDEPQALGDPGAHPGLGLGGRPGFGVAVVVATAVLAVLVVALVVVLVVVVAGADRAEQQRREQVAGRVSEQDQWGGEQLEQ
jgi:hypothetical protein